MTWQSYFLRPNTYNAQKRCREVGKICTQHTPTSYMEDIVESLGLNIIQLTLAIAALAESGIIAHGDPGDRLIVATALAHQAPLITADEKLRATPGLRCIW